MVGESKINCINHLGIEPDPSCWCSKLVLAPSLLVSVCWFWALWRSKGYEILFTEHERCLEEEGAISYLLVCDKVPKIGWLKVWVNRVSSSCGLTRWFLSLQMYLCICSQMVTGEPEWSPVDSLPCLVVAAGCCLERVGSPLPASPVQEARVPHSVAVTQLQGHISACFCRLWFPAGQSKSRASSQGHGGGWDSISVEEGQQSLCSRF